MALSCALRLPHRRLCPSGAHLSSLPGQDHSLLTEKTAAKWKEKKKARQGCSLPGSSWEERYCNSKMTKHSSKAPEAVRAVRWGFHGHPALPSRNRRARAQLASLELCLGIGIMERKQKGLRGKEQEQSSCHTGKQKVIVYLICSSVPERSWRWLLWKQLQKSQETITASYPVVG